jgi:hypothetical protein
MSAMAQIISTSDFNPSTDIAFLKPRINKAGGKQVGITNSKTNRVLQLSTPLMLTWGVNKRVDASTGRVSYDMSLQFPRDGYKSEETDKFLNAIEEMEKFICESAIKNSKEWFNKAKLTDAQVEVLFNPMLYYPKDKVTQERKEGAEPTFRVKLDCYESFNCEIYDIDSKPLYPSSENPEITPVDLIPKMTNVLCVLRCGGVYFVNGKFGVTWKLEQAKVKPPESIKGKWRGAEVTDEDRKKMEEAAEQAQAEADIENDENDSVGVAVQDESDEEDITPVIKAEATKVVQEELDDAIVSSEKKKKVVKKKVIRRKKASEE